MWIWTGCSYPGPSGGAGGVVVLVEAGQGYNKQSGPIAEHLDLVVEVVLLIVLVFLVVV